MSDLNINEIWQVEVSGQVYEASFTELTDWIAEGSLLPDDKIRRGNLRWIEARKVPTLIPFFNGKASGTPAVVVTTTDASPQDGRIETLTAGSGLAQLDNIGINEAFNAAQVPGARASQITNLHKPSNPDQCANHVDRPAKFVCLSCSVQTCRECIKSFGSSVAICSICGGMCKAKAELEDARRREEFKSESVNSGFGFGDFATAIIYPFKFKASLIFGALMFMFFSLGRMASSFGGIYMIVASIFSIMLANMLAFGVLSNTIDSFAHGKIGVNFMPSFDDFELWDDVIHPFFLSIGVYISAFGPFIAVFILGSYLVMSSASSDANAIKANLEQTPGTPYYSARDTIDQSEQVKGVLANSERINQEHLEAQEKIVNGQQPAIHDEEDENVQRINKMISDSKRKELEAVVGKTAETREKESSAFFAGLLKLAAPIVVVGFITLLWGMFFFPAACTVAGYTRSFGATINPLVGLDTIKRLGFDYVKVLFMAMALLITFGTASAIFSFIFAPFDIPGMGNVPAKVFESLFWFYLVIVFACLLGFAMFKGSDRLRLRD